MEQLIFWVHSHRCSSCSPPASSSRPFSSRTSCRRTRGDAPPIMSSTETVIRPTGAGAGTAQGGGRRREGGRRLWQGGRSPWISVRIRAGDGGRRWGQMEPGKDQNSEFFLFVVHKIVLDYCIRAIELVSQKCLAHI